MPKIDLIPTSEAARRLGRNVSTVHRWVRAGRLQPAVKTPGIRGARLFHAADVDRLAEDLRSEAGAA